jgi:hypothetical protein
MDKDTPHSSARQNLLLIGTLIFAFAGTLQLCLVLFGFSHGWAAWVTPFESWALAFLANRESRKHGRGNEDVR